MAEKETPARQLDGNGNKDIWEEMEEAVISSDANKLKTLLTSSHNMNIVLEDKLDSALILAVKLSKADIVEVLLDTKLCHVNKLNAHHFSPLDVALITTFDNRAEPRHAICWNIVTSLLNHGAEPHSRDAMMYVVRTALKYIDDQFINQLLDVFLRGTVAPVAHELLLTKINRSQPIYDGNIDHFLMKISQLAFKIIKNANYSAIQEVVNCLEHYIDSFWTSRELEIKTICSMVVYLTAAGWKWRPQDITSVNRVSKNLSTWCQNISSKTWSLKHLSRLQVRRCAKCSVADITNKLQLPMAIKSYLLLNDVDRLMEIRNTINNITF